MDEEFFDLPVGRHIGKNYLITNYLGSGWEGEVYQVEEKETGIMRVAKFFYEKDNEEKARHIKYAKKLYRLRTCPIIIQYHHKDSVYIKGKRVDFLVSDYTEGEILSQFLKRQRQGRVSTFEALHIFYALIKGIEHIHFMREYHGDIHSDNIIINRSGLSFDIRLIDILHLGKTTKERIQADVYDLVSVLHELVGGDKYYSSAHQQIKNIVLGRKKTLIKKRFRKAAHLRVFMDNLQWS